VVDTQTISLKLKYKVYVATYAPWYCPLLFPFTRTTHNWWLISEKFCKQAKKKGVTTRVALAEKPDSNRNVVKILVLLEFFANPKGLSKSTELGRPVHKFSKQWHRNNNNRCFRRRFKPFKAPTNTRAPVGKWRNIRERECWMG